MVNLSIEQLGMGLILSFLAVMIGFWAATVMTLFWATILGMTAVMIVFACMISSFKRNLVDVVILMVIMVVGSVATWIVVNWFVGLLAPVAIVALATVYSDRKDKEQKK